jgi:hypothetical protein
MNYIKTTLTNNNITTSICWNLYIKYNIKYNILRINDILCFSNSKNGNYSSDRNNNNNSILNCLLNNNNNNNNNNNKYIIINKYNKFITNKVINNIKYNQYKIFNINSIYGYNSLTRFNFNNNSVFHYSSSSRSSKQAKKDPYEGISSNSTIYIFIISFSRIIIFF